MAASPNVADAMREFVSDRVWSINPVDAGESEAVAHGAGPWSRRS